MDPSDQDAQLGGFALADDLAYVESLSGSPEQDVVAASLRRYRSPERLVTGDSLPSVSVHLADETLELMPLDGLVRERPVLLVFGSFT